MPGHILVVMAVEIVVMDAMTVGITIRGATTVAAIAAGAMAATITVVGSMTAAAAAITVATAAITMVTAAAMATGNTAAITADRVSRRGAAATIDASDGGQMAREQGHFPSDLATSHGRCQKSVAPMR